MRVLKLIAIFAAILALPLAGCKQADDPGGVVSSKNASEVRFRVTVEVETPEGVKSGSNIWSLTLIEPTLALVSKYSAEFRGEAVAVDLPEDKTLFVLMKDQGLMPERAFDEILPDDGKHDRIEDIKIIAQQIGQTREVERWGTFPNGTKNDRYPLMVTFEDINDPISVKRVDPDDLAASFGEGTSLKSLKITITDEPVTTGIVKRLEWLRNHRNQSFAGNRYNMSSTLSDSLFAGSFSTEINYEQ